MNKELWKDIPGYEGLYQVSNLGRIKSLSNKKKSQERNNNEAKTRKRRIYENSF